MAGSSSLLTPGFDRVANAGVYFTHAYASAPSCTASRSAILAGQDFWRLSTAAVLEGRFQGSMPSFQRILADVGYHVGFTGKGWGPGLADGVSPVGPVFNGQVTTTGSNDYSANFAEFLNQKPADRPFSFILTPTEPHRPFVRGSGIAGGKSLASIDPPPFLPDTPAVREDLADYFHAIEQQDAELLEILTILEQAGELENTLIMATSDNGMPFPRAKATNYEYGVRVPLAISWPNKIVANQVSDAIVNLTDIAPTLLAAAETETPDIMNGRNLLPLMTASDSEGTASDFSSTVTGFERHIVDAREGNRTYPVRALHTRDFAYIRNFAPGRWPVGAPPRYADIDDTSPSKNSLRSTPALLELATAKRPEEELYSLAADPYQLNNLASEAAYRQLKSELEELLILKMETSADPLLSGGIDAFMGFPVYR
ncbi:MAG: sulfatase [Pseudomonadales bacterium]|nr:sulfatase [Pseudomonadales bacterium]